MAVSSIEKDGFVLLPEFLVAHEISIFRKAVDIAVQSSGEHVFRRPHNELHAIRWNSSLVELFLNSNRRVEMIAGASNADDLRWISGYVSVKQPHSPALWWHQDWWCWDHSASFRRAPPQVAVLCYLTNVNRENGALRLLAGSHHKSMPVHRALPDAHSELANALDAEHVAMTDQPGQQTVSLKPGDAVMLDYRLLHSTHPNESDIRRDCVILNFAPSWRNLPRDIQAHLMCHLAQPIEGEAVPQDLELGALLPTFSGTRASMLVNRNAPATFRIG